MKTFYTTTHLGKLSLLLASALPLASQAQVPTAGPAWAGGLGLGNGVEIHVARTQQRLLLLGRARYKVWGPEAGPGSAFSLLQTLNTRSQQAELAALAGGSLPLGRALAYGAAGVGYVAGRQLGEYRYSVQTNSFLGEATHYYAYRDYQALGVPLEAGLLLPESKKRPVRLGLAFQANLNPEHSAYCALLTFWFGHVGPASR